MEGEVPRDGSVLGVGRGVAFLSRPEVLVITAAATTHSVVSLMDLDVTMIHIISTNAEHNEDQLNQIKGEEIMVFTGTRWNPFSIPIDSATILKWKKG